MPLFTGILAGNGRLYVSEAHDTVEIDGKVTGCYPVEIVNEVPMPWLQVFGEVEARCAAEAKQIFTNQFLSDVGSDQWR